MIARFVVAWSRLTPWWWAYAPMAVAEAILIALFVAGWGPRAVIYASIRVVSFATVGLSAIDLSKHKAFYNRRRYARDKTAQRTGRRNVGLVIGVGAASLAVVAVILVLARDPEGAGSTAFFALLLAFAAVYLVRTSTPITK